MDFTNFETLWLNPLDNVVIALRAFAPDEIVVAGGARVKVKDPIPKGHKMAIQTIQAGAVVIKFGEEIGEAVKIIVAGEHVHVHNVRDITADATSRERSRLGL